MYLFSDNFKNNFSREKKPFIGIYKYNHNPVKEENKKKTYKEWSTF